MSSAWLLRLRMASCPQASSRPASPTNGWRRDCPALGRLHAGLPDDLLNFQYDPVACAGALGWPGATVAEARLQLVRDGELRRFQPGTAGRPIRMLTDLDPGSFTEYWLNAVEAAQSPA
jgi:hypothetical protein